MEQINKIPKYMSHYCRNETSTMFLPSHLSLAKLYDIYKNEIENSVTFSIYKRIFYNKFNMMFKVPQKDTCQICNNKLLE